jgi:formylglycine-generating enzyme required for sulfatase activity
MLQAREIACIIILTFGAALATSIDAQDSEPDSAEPVLRRIGDSPVVDALELDPITPGTADVDQVEGQFAQEDRVQESRQRTLGRLLESAVNAARAGRIDQPPGDCAWYYYRAMLDIDPENADAQRGLEDVQQHMISRAKKVARELDFESADRMLEEASLVRDDPRSIENAEEEIRNFRADQAAELESAAVSAMDLGEFKRAERVLIELIALGETYDTVNQLRRRMEEARVYGGFKPGQTVRDHFMHKAIWTPESVIVLAGSFVMGSSAFEDDRRDNEGPQHRVTFRRGFAIGKTEVTVKQFREFVANTKYRTDAEKLGYSTVYDHYSGRLMRRDDADWESDYEGKQAGDDNPVVHVSWNDARAYVNWLANGTGKRYRLPSEAEFEYALRAGKSSRYWWGDGVPPDVVENLTGEKDLSRSRRSWSTFFEGYTDNHWGPAPVASFKLNAFGLYDMGGNVAEWVTDCWHDTFLRAPADGSSWVNPGCEQRVIRGGYWASSPEQARSAYRLAARSNHRDGRIGFRIARDL